MQGIGVDLPVRPRKRYVFAFDCPKGPKDLLLAVDTSGCWFRKEGSGSLFLCGKSPNEVRIHIRSLTVVSNKTLPYQFWLTEYIFG